MNKAISQQKKSQKTEPKKSKDVENIPIWMKQDIKKEDVSKEEMDELEQLMKGI